MSKRKMDFNIAGPCIPDKHYMLDPLRGMGATLTDLINSGYYFVIQAARQSGKTTLLKQLTRDINAKGDYYALYCSLEVIQGLIEPEKGILAIVKRLQSAFEENEMIHGFAVGADYGDIANVLRKSLTAYCRTLSKPLVIFFDEADCLSNGTLITFFRQLRDGYINKSDVPFVHSLAIVGMRNIRDYTATIRPDSETFGSSSPFNIVTKTFNLRNFTKAEVADLYTQHTYKTSQIFEPQAVDYAFEQTQGQPWLINAIARECVEEITKKDYVTPITQNITEQAIQNLILARGTHFDSLMERLKEPRVKKIISPLVTGEEIVDRMSDDYLYVRDLGLIRDDCGKTEAANPIYAEIIIRALSWSAQVSIMEAHKEYVIPRYLKGGRIDMDFLMRDFQEYWRENSEIWINRYKTELYEYDEAAAHLVLHAFMQRIINGGGQVRREMAVGTRRVDLCVIYERQKYPIELKILQSEKSRSSSLEQIWSYMDIVGSNSGWLVIFDKDTKKNWEDKIFMKEESLDGKKIVIVGC